MVVWVPPAPLLFLHIAGVYREQKVATLHHLPKAVYINAAYFKIGQGLGAENGCTYKFLHHCFGI